MSDYYRNMRPQVRQELTWLGKRMREPSTYLGLGMFLAAIHIGNAEGWASAVTSIGIGIGGVIGVLLPES